MWPGQGGRSQSLQGLCKGGNRVIGRSAMGLWGLDRWTHQWGDFYNGKSMKNPHEMEVFIQLIAAEIHRTTTSLVPERSQRLPPKGVMSSPSQVCVQKNDTKSALQAQGTVPRVQRQCDTRNSSKWLMIQNGKSSFKRKAWDRFLFSLH